MTHLSFSFASRVWSRAGGIAISFFSFLFHSTAGTFLRLCFRFVVDYGFSAADEDRWLDALGSLHPDNSQADDNSPTYQDRGTGFESRLVYEFFELGNLDLDSNMVYLCISHTKHQHVTKLTAEVSTDNLNQLTHATLRFTDTSSATKACSLIKTKEEWPWKQISTKYRHLLQFRCFGQISFLHRRFCWLFDHIKCDYWRKKTDFRMVMLEFA